MVKNIKSQMQSYYAKILRLTSAVWNRKLQIIIRRFTITFNGSRMFRENAQNLMKNMRTSLRCNAPLEDWKFLKKTYTF